MQAALFSFRACRSEGAATNIAWPPGSAGLKGAFLSEAAMLLRSCDNAENSAPRKGSCEG